MHWIEVITRAAGRLAGWLALAMIVLGAATPLVRWLGKDLALGTWLTAGYEGQWYLFAAVFMLAGAAVLGQDRHVRVDVIHARLGTRARAWIDLIGSVALLLPFALFGLVASWRPVARAFAIREAAPTAGGLPRYPIKALLLVGFALLALQAVYEAARRMGELRRARASASTAVSA